MKKNPLSSTNPNIADELVDASLADVLTHGSSKRVDWKCSVGHVWTASPNTRTNGHGCPVCAGKKVLPGFNDLASQRPEIAAELVDASLATTVTARSGKKVAWRCGRGHEWTASINTRTNGHGCPVCAGKKVLPGFNDLATTRPDVAVKLVDQAAARRVSAFSSKVLEWTCDDGHVWKAPVARIASGASCPACSGLTAAPGQTDIATTRPDLAAQLVDESLATTLKASTNRKVLWRCENGHEWEASPNARSREKTGTGCPVCTNRLVLTGVNDLTTTHRDLADQAIDDVSGLTYGSKHPITWRCDKGHEWVARPNDRTTSNSGCPSCAASRFVSRGESEVAGIIQTLVPDLEVRTTVRDVLARGELDVVVDDLGIAVEFNGLWWHSEAHLSRTYHADKAAAAAAAGLRLIHVWADDWADRRDIVIRGLAHRLGATTRLLDVLPDADPNAAGKAFARTLTPDNATSAEATAFWTANHLQGPVGSTYRFALRDDEGRIRALLGVGRRNHGSRVNPAPGTWDVQRYATLGSVPGGFTRLLAHAERAMRAAGEMVTTWTSYSDDDVSDGGMYQAAKFVVDKVQPPSYSYIGALTSWKRAHRTRFVKQLFIDDDALVYIDGMTEHEAATANGLYRVYDAGKTRWVKPAS